LLFIYYNPAAQQGNQSVLFLIFASLLLYIIFIALKYISGLLTLLSL